MLSPRLEVRGAEGRGVAREHPVCSSDLARNQLDHPAGPGQGGQVHAAEVGGAEVGDVHGEVRLGPGGLAGGAVGAALQPEAALVARPQGVGHLQHQLALGGVAPGPQRRRQVQQPHPELVADVGRAQPPGVGEAPAGGLVDRPVEQPDDTDQVKVQAVAPQGGVGLRGEPDEVPHLGDVARHAFRPVLLHPVADPAVDPARRGLVDDVDVAAEPVPGPFGVTDVPLPPVRLAADLPRLAVVVALVEGGQDLGRLLRLEHAQAAGAGCDAGQERAVAGVDLVVGEQGGHAVAEAAVDDRLGGAERRHRLAARLDVLEMAQDHRAQDAPAAMGRQHRDGGQATHRDAGASRQGQLQRVGAAGADDAVAVEGRHAPLELEAALVVGELLVAGGLAEDDPHDPGELGPLLGRDRPDLDVHTPRCTRNHGSGPTDPPDRAWRRAGVSPLANKETRGNGAGLPGCRLRKPDRAGDRGRRRRRGGVLQARLAAAEVAVPRQAQRQGLAAPMEAPARPGVASQADAAGTASRPAGRRERLWALLELVAGLAGERVRRAVHLLMVTGLLALLALEVGKNLTSLRGAALVAVAALAGVAGGLLHARWSGLRLWLRYLAPAPIVFALVFLLASPVSKLMLPQPGGEVNANSPGVRIRAEHPVVMLLLDEFPLTSLLDSKGRIDQRLYPNIAKLAGGSTWYRNATAVSGLTDFAVPAMLDGRYPQKNVPATAAQYPDNLFTLLAKSYDVEPFQIVTQLCPTKTCKTNAATAPTAVGLGNTLRDSARVFKRVAWPQDVDENPTGAWLNATTAEKTKRPAPAAGNGPASKVLEEIDEGNEPDQYRNFVASIEGSDRPTFYFLHILMPHQT